MTFLCYIYFIILSIIGLNLLFKPYGIVKSPFNKNQLLKCTGLELFFIFMFATGLLGLIPVLALRLAVLELFCIIALFKSVNRPQLSFPIVLYSLFLLWAAIGVSYSPSTGYGFRMMSKYLYPLIVTLTASSIVRNTEIFVKCSVLARSVALFSIWVALLPPLNILFTDVFWHRAAEATHYGVISLMSLTFCFYTNEKKKNFLLFCITAIIPFIWVFRTNIMELMVGIAGIYFIKYHVKSLPVLGLIVVLSVSSIFLIPSVKKKMFFRPDEVTFEKYINGQVDESNINTSGRKVMWDDILRIYDQHPVVGNGTGRVQYRFYEEFTDWRREGQLHNDMLVILTDNGIVGFVLYMLAVLGCFVHCFWVYWQKRYDAPVKILSLIAGPSVVAVFLTMYSDNTISYSMCTMAYPWAFYGMMLGLMKSQK